MRIAALAVVLLVTACGGGSGPTAQTSIRPTAAAAETPYATQSPLVTASPIASPGQVTPPAAGLLFAVVENGTASGGCGGPTCISADTIAIVGLDGYAKAKATFVPRKLPPIGNSAVILQAPAVVAGSGVYYLDGNGTVRVLRVNSSPQVVATFSQKGQPYETWFAVNPDGSDIVAGVLTFDATGSSFTLYTAKAGSSPTQTVNSESVYPPSQMANLPFPIGWISAGPVAMDPISLTTQNAWIGGPLQVLTFGPGGVQGTIAGGADCRSASITAGGLIPCVSSKEVVSVRDMTGKLIWTTHVAGFMATSLYLSPDGQAISDGQQQSKDGGATWYMTVETHTRGAIQMPNSFLVEGFLDNNTVIGRSGGDGNLSWVSLDDPTTVHDLGFKGDFISTLT